MRLKPTSRWFPAAEELRTTAYRKPLPPLVANLGRDPHSVRSPLVGRLNLGAIATNQIRWDQPHEGNLFDHLYARRAFQQECELVVE